MNLTKQVPNMGSFVRNINARIMKWLYGDPQSECEGNIIKDTSQRNNPPDSSENTSTVDSSTGQIEASMNKTKATVIVSDSATGQIVNELEIYLASGFAMTDDEDEPDGGNNGDSDDGPGAPQGKKRRLPVVKQTCKRRRRRGTIEQEIVPESLLTCFVCGKQFAYEKALLVHKYECGLPRSERRADRIRFRQWSSQDKDVPMEGDRAA